MDLPIVNGIYQGAEGLRLEFKSAAHGLPRSFWETYSSFANSFGGRIILGIGERNGQHVVEGVGDPLKMTDDLWSLLHDPTKVSGLVLMDEDVQICEADGKSLIVVDVPRADRHQRPVYVNGSLENGTYRRNGSGDYHCLMPEITSMLRDQSDQPIDGRLIEQQGLDALDPDTLHAFRNAMRQQNFGHVWNDLPDEKFLQVVGAADRDRAGVLRPTAAGLLMFGHEYCIAREYPNFRLDYLEFQQPGFDWSDRFVSGTGEWSGNLYDFFTTAIRKLGLILPRPFALGRDLRREDDTELHKAVREGLINALIHADYSGLRGIRLEVRPQAITIQNPGLFRIPLAAAEAGGASDPRNPILAKLFAMIGGAERAGSGVYRILSAWKNSGLGRPQYTEQLDPPRVQLTLPLRPAGAGNDMLNLMQQNGTITIDELSAQLGLGRTKVVKEIAELKDQGLVVREGRTRGRWVVRR